MAIILVKLSMYLICIILFVYFFENFPIERQLYALSKEMNNQSSVYALNKKELDFVISGKLF